MNVRYYNLVNTTSDKLIAIGKGLMFEVPALVASWALLIRDPHDLFTQDLWPILLPICILSVLVPGPLVLIEALTMRIRVTDEGISRVSAAHHPREQWIKWQRLIGVDVRSDPSCRSGIKKVVVRGWEEMHGITTYRIVRRVVIPGHLPDIDRILALAREYESANSAGQTDAG
jgi:hypothetical protein